MTIATHPRIFRWREWAAPVRPVQREVLTNPWIWLCGIASALVYAVLLALWFGLVGPFDDEQRFLKILQG